VQYEINVRTAVVRLKEEEPEVRRQKEERTGLDQQSSDPSHHQPSGSVIERKLYALLMPDRIASGIPTRCQWWTTKGVAGRLTAAWSCPGRWLRSLLRWHIRSRTGSSASGKPVARFGALIDRCDRRADTDSQTDTDDHALSSFARSPTATRSLLCQSNARRAESCPSLPPGVASPASTTAVLRCP
jgi:hypothetical protein